ncbi:MAG: galactokinase [Terriglobales bacterium]
MTSAAASARAQAVAGFRRAFGGTPELVARAPGRVNLIGEHTDYNQGLVLPVAISLATYAAVRRRDVPRLRMASRAFPGITEAPLPPVRPRGDWTDYVTGTARALWQRGLLLPGADIWIEGQIPPGAGLSSSAALEVAAGLALLRLGGEQRPLAELAWELILAAQAGEREWAGADCGFMDQASAVLAQAGCALQLDCRSRETEYVPLSPGVELAVCHTGVRHDLASSAYNQRRRECDAAVRALAPYLPGLQSLRDVTPEALARYSACLPSLLARRARHVVSENARVPAASAALRAGDWTRLRTIFAASHASLRDDYEVSCPELDAMVEAANEAPGFLAGRMTGGGFGGCTVNLVAADQAGAFAAVVAAGYQARQRRPAQVYRLESGASATIES